jgi:hypothetical protein
MSAIIKSYGAQKLIWTQKESRERERRARVNTNETERAWGTLILIRREIIKGAGQRWILKLLRDDCYLDAL